MESNCKLKAQDYQGILNINKLNTEFKIISDYEGENLNIDETKNYIICGDILDSTVGFKGTFDFLQKDYNIRNIITIVNNIKNCTLIYGNRDINKLKTIQLTLLNDTTLGTNWNNGNINLSNETYESYKKNTTLEWKADTINWIPFWNGTITKNLFDEKLEKTENFKKWSIDTKFTEKPFLTRFNKIFGVDGNVGTMSAGNLLHTIPKEVLGESFYIQNKTNEDYLAFITLAIFRTMSLKDSNQHIYKEIDTQIILNKTYLKGLLINFYKSPNTLFVGYKDTFDRLILFSHGGITNTLINTECNYTAYMVHITSNINTLIQKNRKDNETNKINQLGGFNEVHSKNKIINKLYNLNLFFKELVNTVLISTSTSPIAETLLLLALTAPYDPKSVDKKYNNLDFINSSPINPGISDVLNNKFFCSDRKIVQIFGHVPRGYGTGLYKFTQPKNGLEGDNYELNIINLDTSQSFRYMGYAGSSSNYINIGKNNDIIINTDIDPSQLTYSEKYEIKPEPTKNMNISDLIKINGKLEELLNKNKKSYNYYTFIYHSTSIVSGKEYLVYSHVGVKDNVIGFEKELHLQPLENQQGGNYKEKYLKYKQKYLQLKQSL